jgi:hypothetical protein
VNPSAYSSLTAFLAHWRALRESTSRSPEQSERRAQMEAAIAELTPAERDAIDSETTGGAAARHRQRAQRHLSQILRDRGWLAG